MQVYHIDKEANERIYLDQTGQFPVRSSQGMEHGLVLVKIDRNYTYLEPMKTRLTGELISACQDIVGRLNASGIYPRHHIFDNKISRKFK